MDPYVIGLDLSLTSTGMACLPLTESGQGPRWTRVLKAPATLSGLDRLRWLTFEVSQACRMAHLVVLEGPAYGSAAAGRQGRAGHHERAGLWWLVRAALDDEAVPVAVAPPNLRAKYATGRGNAGKADVVREAARRFPWHTGGEDEADALVLAAMGTDRLECPSVAMPATHRAALDGVAWPDGDR